MTLSAEEFTGLSQAVQRSVQGAYPEKVTQNVLSYALGQFAGRIAVISSFGAESALLLFFVAQHDRTTPVFFLDTHCHFPETLTYRDRLVAHLKLETVQTLTPSARALMERDPQDQLFTFDPDACCSLRKVEPFNAVQPLFDLWITGRKRMQAATRAALPVVERQKGGGVKLNPLAGWSSIQIAEAMKEMALPRHPLVAQGYRSIGCVPCTRPVGDDEDSRAGRWSGFAKTECGLHRPVPSVSVPN